MGVSFLKVFAIFAIVSGWVKKAFADGKVSVKEGLELVTQLAEALEIPLEWDIPEVVSDIAEDVLVGQEAVVAEGPEIEPVIEHDSG